MKKLFKFILGLGVVAAIVGGAIYFFKNVLMKDYLDDENFDEDFDNDLYDGDEDRDYVTLNNEADEVVEEVNLDEKITDTVEAATEETEDEE